MDLINRADLSVWNRTVILKTWRLFYIFKSSLNLRKSYHVTMSDGVLAVLIMILLAPIVGLCTAWSIFDLEYYTNTGTIRGHFGCEDRRILLLYVSSAMDSIHSCF